MQLAASAECTRLVLNRAMYCVRPVPLSGMRSMARAVIYAQTVTPVVPSERVIHQGL
jgi:hypothetical protein